MNSKIRNVFVCLDHPLNIRYISVRNITNSSITIDWEDDSYNRNANITYYELVLKYEKIHFEYFN